MNRRKFLGACAGVAATGAAMAKATAAKGTPLELSSDLFLLDAEEFRHLAKQRKVLWVRSTNLYAALRKGWKEHPWHITRFVGKSEMAHLMVRRG